VITQSANIRLRAARFMPLFAPSESQVWCMTRLTKRYESSYRIYVDFGSG
jgi:hypothetical protein